MKLTIETEGACSIPHEILIARIETMLHQMEQRILTAMTATDDAIAVLQADEASLKTELAGLATVITTFQTDLAAAIAAAGQAGATPAELQALTDLHTALSADIASVKGAEAAAPPAPAPAAA
jgi:hypothetical protein